MKHITLSGVGCCLIDRLYNNVSFSSDTFAKYSSKERGDGGLSPGHLVLKEQFEVFAKKEYTAVLSELTSERSADKINIGGPGIVSLIHAAQIVNNNHCAIHFYGCHGDDEEGDYLRSLLSTLPVNLDNYLVTAGSTPSTDVLSDPGHNNGQGERTFINSIGSAWKCVPRQLDDNFFSSDIVVFGGTALVPRIHENLTGLLRKAKDNGCITVVNTVFDFINERKNPLEKWPLGNSDKSYQDIDLLITDKEEALRLSGKKSIEDAMRFFIEKKTGATIITNGSKDICLHASGPIFGQTDITRLPVSKAISKQIQSKEYGGDTTGCGDNCAGGVISSLILQLQRGKTVLDVTEASIMGIVSGGYACLYLGGTYVEKKRGEKYELLLPYLHQYMEQLEETKGRHL